MSRNSQDSSSSSDYDDHHRSRARSRLHGSTRQEILAEISIMQNKISRYKPMVLSESSVKDLNDRSIRNFMNHNCLRKHDIKYKTAIKDLLRHEENFLRFSQCKMSDTTKQTLEDSKVELKTVLEQLNDTKEYLHAEASIRIHSIFWRRWP